MRFALGMDNREIARALGRTDGATKVLLHRAIKQLEELVQKAEGPTADMSSERAIDIETMLRQALAPVEPPEELAAAAGEHARLAGRAGRRRARVVGALDARRPASNWARLGRPAAAAVVGSGRRRGLVVLRTRRQRHRRRAQSSNVAELRRAHAARRRARGAASCSTTALIRAACAA